MKHRLAAAYFVASAAEALDRRANEGHSAGKVTHDDPRRNAQHAILKPFEVPVAPRVSGAPMRVSAAVDFNDEPYRRGDEVSDVAVTDDDLPAKGNTQPPATQLLPKQELRTLREAPHVLRPGREQVLATFSN